MLTIARPAKFGLRDKTIYNKKVRYTNEITADKIDINYDDAKLRVILDDIKNELNLPSSIRLKPNLHNILIYSKDQFFAKHQDTEKLDGMVATLVMVLPSPHIGGALVVEHYGEKKEFRSENISSENIKFIAFYSDCYHEVQKVLDGYRVVVTYNLVVEPDVNGDSASAKDREIVNKYKDALKETLIKAFEEQIRNNPRYIPLKRLRYIKSSSNQRSG